MFTLNKSLLCILPITFPHLSLQTIGTSLNLPSLANSQRLRVSLTLNGAFTTSRLKRGKETGGEGGRSARCYQSIIDPRGQKQVLSLSVWPRCGQCKITVLHIWVPKQRGLNAGVKRWQASVLSSTPVLGYFLLRNKSREAPKGLPMPF